MNKDNEGFNDETPDKSTTQKKGLGRGLSALLGNDAEDLKDLQKIKASSRDIPIENIFANPNQPRKYFDKKELDNLAESINRKGILQPIIVRQLSNEKDHFEIIAGERRWRAAQLAKLEKVPATIKHINETELLEISIIENIQRENLNPIEEAEAYKNLISLHSVTQEKISKEVGKSRSHIANTIRLLNLPTEVKSLLVEGKISAGHGRALLKTKDPIESARKIIDEGLNVRSSEKIDSNTKKENKLDKSKDANTIALEKDISQALGYSVDIDYISDDKEGKIKIIFKNLDQLDDIVHRLLRPR
ncbi:MAG: Chromosome-partitioning protein ParB [Alphaproteobacteria bacterium MarineAlpha2_Bin1]|nr:MAG: Chromosome-partitioning protein ParB [Alphaproteobacteria bacterium MarineAlpha2_Bin1]